MKIVKMVGLLMAGLMSWFSPIQMVNNGICCVGCDMKKEDEIELTIDEVVDDTI